MSHLPWQLLQQHFSLKDVGYQISGHVVTRNGNAIVGVHLNWFASKTELSSIPVRLIIIPMDTPWQLHYITFYVFIWWFCDSDSIHFQNHFEYMKSAKPLLLAAAITKCHNIETADRIVFLYLFFIRQDASWIDEFSACGRRQVGCLLPWCHWEGVSHLALL